MISDIIIKHILIDRCCDDISTRVEIRLCDQEIAYDYDSANVQTY